MELEKCFIGKLKEQSEVTLAEYRKKKLKWVVSKHLTHSCYPIRLVLY